MLDNYHIIVHVLCVPGTFCECVHKRTHIHSQLPVSNAYNALHYDMPDYAVSSSVAVAWRRHNGCNVLVLIIHAKNVITRIKLVR